MGAQGKRGSCPASVTRRRASASLLAPLTEAEELELRWKAWRREALRPHYESRIEADEMARDIFENGEGTPEERAMKAIAVLGYAKPKTPKRYAENAKPRPYRSAFHLLVNFEVLHEQHGARRVLRKLSEYYHGANLPADARRRSMVTVERQLRRALTECAQELPGYCSKLPKIPRAPRR